MYRAPSTKLRWRPCAICGWLDYQRLGALRLGGVYPGGPFLVWAGGYPHLWGDMLRQLIVPVVVLAMLASLLLPLPSWVVDLLLVGNLIVALVLFVSTFYITDSLHLSSLPVILLLATLFRLALNISTTRLVLGRGEAGRVVEAFGAVVVQGDLVVGAVVFLMITFIQFVVIAKGAERVAEVSARFTLDALPGKQLSIDADVRAGLMDFEQARRKRQEIQLESRFYGALDGAMKFVKGDAIAGLVIVGINIAGGLAVGLLVNGLDLPSALAKYTMLTIGDGLASQIPALLNALAAGMVITRVGGDGRSSLAEELFSQLWQTRRAKMLVGVIALVLAFVPAMPFFPFFALSAALFIGAAAEGKNVHDGKPVITFRPKVPPVLEVRLGAVLAQELFASGTLASGISQFQQQIFDQTGLMLLPPEFSAGKDLEREWVILMRGVTMARNNAPSEDGKKIWASIAEALKESVNAHPAELVDDIHTRRILDHFDQYAPELVSAVVPGVVSVTQLTEILKGLVREGLSIRNFDLILQAVAEQGAKAGGERRLYEEVRVALRRVICARYESEGVIRGYLLDPVLDLAFAKSEREDSPVEIEHVLMIEKQLEQRAEKGAVLVTAKGGRRLIQDCLEMRGVNMPVLAHEELVDEVRFVPLGRIEISSPAIGDRLIEGLAC